MGLLSIVQSEFAAIGINISISLMSLAQYTSAVSTLHQDQMGYGSPCLGLSSDPLSDLGAFYPGFIANDANVNDPVYNNFYTQALAASSLQSLEQIAMNANQYVPTQHYVVCLTAGNILYIYQPWLKGGFWGQNQGLVSNQFMRLSEYGARMWVDQSLKP